MGDVNGVELARDLPQGTLLIFTTAYAEYALDGFDLNAVDFLHKPFSYGRFEKAVQKAFELHALQQLSASPVFTEESITLKVGYKSTNVKLKDILTSNRWIIMSGFICRNGNASCRRPA